MSLTHLNIHGLRNIGCESFTLDARLNLICGPNGTGKTSFLEAIYLLSCGRSFRSRETLPLIRFESESLTLFARTNQNETISFQRTRSGETKVRLNQQPCLKSSELAHFLPCQLFYQDMFQIIDAGPAIRRGVLDWGMFHVEHSFHTLWKNHRQVLKQRNALLRQKAPSFQFQPWNKQLVELSTEIDGLRQQYFKEWVVLFQFYLNKLTFASCDLGYYKGWDKKNSGKSLAVILEEQFASDLHRQFTQSGAHQADLYFETQTLRSKQFLSRGQQKMILIALKLAQTSMLAKPCIYLMDDIAAELDPHHLEKLIRCLAEVNGQFFITSLQESPLFDLGRKHLGGVNLISMDNG